MSEAQRGRSEALWSTRFLDRLAALGVLRAESLEPPLPSVSQLTVTAGSVGARAADADGGRGYDVWVELAAFDARQWTRAEQALAAHRGAREALLDGELPLRVDGVLARAGLSLLPVRAEDLTLECSCPKWSSCDHLAAVLAALARPPSTPTPFCWPPGAAAAGSGCCATSRSCMPPGTRPGPATRCRRRTPVRSASGWRTSGPRATSTGR
ncbi:hypothetical protein [Streptacidiphilus sp. PAMC 29251]